MSRKTFIEFFLRFAKQKQNMKDLLSLRTIDSDQELSEIEDEDFIVDSTHEIAHTLEGRPSPSINNTLPTMEDQESANENEIESENDVQDIVKTRPVLPGAAKAVSDYFQVPEQTVAQSVFTSLQISRPLLKAIQAMGFVKPTEIQSQTIPLAMQGKDICASAVTGSGKTLAFMVPVLERLLFRPKHKAQTRVLVLVPTRELGSQCHAVGIALAQFTQIQLCLCVGNVILYRWTRFQAAASGTSQESRYCYRYTRSSD